MVDQVNNNTEIKKPVEQAKTEKKDDLNVEKFTKSVWNSGASASYGMPDSYAMFNADGIFGGGNMFNPAFVQNGAFQEKFVPSATSLFSVPNYFAPASFGGYIKNMWDTWNKMFPSKTAEVDNTKKDEVTDTRTDAEKLTAIKEEAKKYNVAVEDKDTYESIKTKVDAAKIKAGEKPVLDEATQLATLKDVATKLGIKYDETVTLADLQEKVNTSLASKTDKTGGSGSKHNKADEINPRDITSESGAYNHLYTDKNGNRICKKYNPEGELTYTITFDKNGKLLSSVKTEKKAEAVETAKTAKTTSEASKICKELFISMKGAGTDDDKLKANVNKINSGNVLEVMQEWNKRYSSKMGSESLIESINSDLHFEDSKYITHIKDAMVQRATKMGLGEDAEAFDAQVSSETGAFITWEPTVETAFDEMLNLMEEKQK